MNSLKHLGLSVTMFLGACSSFAVIPVLAFEWPWDVRKASQEVPQYEGSSYDTESSLQGSYEPTEALYTQEDVSCMAEAIYFEARGESYAGQVAVGLVILKRSRSERYPASICEVISQNDHRRDKCMFSYRCDGKSEDIPKENNVAYNLAVSISECVLEGECSMPAISQATMYYACDGENKIPKPRSWDWKKLRTMGAVGNQCYFSEVDV